MKQSNQKEIQSETEKETQSEFILIPYVIFDLIKDDHSAYLIYSLIVKRADNNPRGCYQTQEHIAEELNMSESTANRCLKKLEELNLVHAIRRPKYRGQYLPNIYYLNKEKSTWVLTKKYLEEQERIKEKKSDPTQNPYYYQIPALMVTAGQHSQLLPAGFSHYGQTRSNKQDQIKQEENTSFHLSYHKYIPLPSEADPFLGNLEMSEDEKLEYEAWQQSLVYSYDIQQNHSFLPKVEDMLSEVKQNKDEKKEKVYPNRFESKRINQNPKSIEESFAVMQSYTQQQTFLSPEMPKPWSIKGEEKTVETVEHETSLQSKNPEAEIRSNLNENKSPNICVTKNEKSLASPKIYPSKPEKKSVKASQPDEKKKVSAKKDVKEKKAEKTQKEFSKDEAKKKAIENNFFKTGIATPFTQNLCAVLNKNFIDYYEVKNILNEVQKVHNVSGKTIKTICLELKEYEPEFLGSIFDSILFQHKNQFGVDPRHYPTLRANLIHLLINRDSLLAEFENKKRLEKEAEEKAKMRMEKIVPILELERMKQKEKRAFELMDKEKKDEESITLRLSSMSRNIRDFVAHIKEIAHKQAYADIKINLRRCNDVQFESYVNGLRIYKDWEQTSQANLEEEEVNWAQSFQHYSVAV